MIDIPPDERLLKSGPARLVRDDVPEPVDVYLLDQQLVMAMPGTSKVVVVVPLASIKERAQDVRNDPSPAIVLHGDFGRYELHVDDVADWRSILWRRLYLKQFILSPAR